MEEEVGIDADLVFIPVLDQRVWARGCQLARFLATQRPQLTLVLVGAEGTRKACGRAELPKSVVQIFVRVKSKKDRITALDHLRRVVLERLAPSGSA